MQGSFKYRTKDQSTSDENTLDRETGIHVRGSAVSVASSLQILRLHRDSMKRVLQIVDRDYLTPALSHLSIGQNEHPRMQASVLNRPTCFRRHWDALPSDFPKIMQVLSSTFKLANMRTRPLNLYTSAT